jgi:hypothetical protein
VFGRFRCQDIKIKAEGFGGEEQVGELGLKQEEEDDGAEQLS